MRFPTATWPQVRKVVAQQLSAIPHARRRAVIAVVFLLAGAAANVTIPILLGKIVDAVTTGASIALLGVLLIGVAGASAAIGGGILCSVPADRARHRVPARGYGLYGTRPSHTPRRGCRNRGLGIAFYR